MKKLLKIIGILFLVIVILVGVAVTVTVTMLDQATIKNKLAETVAQKTGRQLIFQGNASLSFFPWVGLRVTNVKLTNNKIFKNTEFANVGELDVRVRLLPLISKKVEVDKFILKNVDLTLIKNRAGYTDWQDLTQVINLNAATNQTNSTLDLLTINNIEIINGHIIWQNQQTEQKLEISKLNFSSGNVNFSDPFTLQGGFAFTNLAPAMSGDMQMHATITLDVRNKMYLLRDFSVNGKVMNSTFVKPLDFAVSAEVTADLNKETLEASDLRIKLADMVAVGEGKCIALLSAPKVNANVTVASFDATSLLQLFGLAPTTDAWKNVAFQTDIETTSKFVKFPKIKAQIGAMQLSGAGSYSHFNDKIASFSLDLNKLNLADFALKPYVVTKVAVKGSSKKTATVAKIAKDKVGDGMAFDIIRAIKLIGDLHVGTMQLNKVALSNFDVTIDGDHGLINADSFSTNFYNGKINGTAAIDLRKPIPVISVKSVMSGSSLQKILSDFAAFDKVTGVITVDSNLTMRGVNGDALFRSMSGSGKLLITNGIYHGMDLAYQVRRANAIINQKPMPEESKPAQTNFGKVTSTFTLNNALFSTNDLAIQAADINAKGHGTANLATQVINFQITAFSPNDRNFFVPINITNTFSNPDVRPDINAIAKHVVAGAVQQQIEKQIVKNINNKNLQDNILKALPNILK